MALPHKKKKNSFLGNKKANEDCLLVIHTARHGVESDAVDMEATVAEVAEEHLVVVCGLATRAASLALGTLPRVVAALADRVRAQLQARRVHCVVRKQQ